MLFLLQFPLNPFSFGKNVSLPTVFEYPVIKNKALFADYASEK